MAVMQLEVLSGSALLDEVDALHRTQLQIEVQILQAVAAFARQHGEGTVDAEQARLPGRERAVQVGGDGTPRVAEFAPAALAARLQLSAYAGARLVADVLDLEHRLPRLWARLKACEVRPGHARFVARKTRELSREEAAYVDARVAESADGRLSWSRFESLVEASIIAADPDTAAAREEAAARNAFAKPTHSTEHGMRGFYIRADFATIARLDATVAYIARALLALGDTSCLDDRRVKALLIMANPGQAVRILRAYEERERELAGTPEVATEPQRFDPTDLPEILDPERLLPPVQLYVHLAGGFETLAGARSSTNGDVARIEGAGPVTADWVRRTLGERCRFRIAPVIDPLDQVPVDAWEIPRRHRQAVHLLTPADTFPFASNTTRNMQIDHTQAWSEERAREGERQSRIGNYGPMTTFHHRVKTHGRWQVRQPFAGLYVWRDPHGATYVVDHSGTRRVPAVTPRRPRSTSRLEIYLSEQLTLAA